MVQLHIIPKGNIFQNNQADAIVIPTNTGTSYTPPAMGAGLAKTAKQLYPELEQFYLSNPKIIGKPMVYTIPNTNQSTKPKYIILLHTKTAFTLPSKPEYIKAGLEELIPIIKQYNIQSIAIPPLGTGLGKLPYKTFQTIFNQWIETLQQLHDINLEIFHYQSGP